MNHHKSVIKRNEPTQICHPERSLARFLRQTQPKDLRLLLGTQRTRHSTHVNPDASILFTRE
jgi:hypothetical protein